MTTKQLTLDTIGIAAPCTAAWDDMQGDDRQRYCRACKLNVYNLSGMTRQEGEDLIARHESRLCVRYFRRADGTVLTRDCPVGLRRRVRMAWMRCAALLAAVFAGVPGCGPRTPDVSTGGAEPPAIVQPPLMGEVYAPEVGEPEQPLMGKVQAR